jgi:hypothetical protein
LLFENAVNRHKYSVTLTEDDKRADGSYSKTLDISPHEPPGAFALKQMIIKTKAGETRTWSSATNDDPSVLPLPYPASFTVQTGVGDSNPPILSGLGVSERIRGDADDKTDYPLWVEASDAPSGIDYIIVKFKDPASGETLSKVLRDAHLKDGRYTGPIVVKEEQVPGVYDLDSVTLCDRAGNRIVYCCQKDLTDQKRLLPVRAALDIH